MKITKIQIFFDEKQKKYQKIICKHKVALFTLNLLH